MLADTAKYPSLPFPFFFFFSSFFSPSSTIGNGTSLQFGVAYKQAQPLLEVRFGEGACPVGRPGMGRWFLMDDY